MKGFEPSKPSAWEADALPTELHSQNIIGGPARVCSETLAVYETGVLTN